MAIGAVTLRPSSDGAWWALNQRELGFASIGYRYSYLGDALDALAARIADCGVDKHGLYLTAVPHGAKWRDKGHTRARQ